MTAQVVRARGLSRRFREVVAVDGVDLVLAPGVVTGLLGRNGAGKSTLMQLLTGQQHRTAGSLTVFGSDPWENAAVLAQTCFVRENQQYPDDFRLRQVLSAAAAVYPGWDRPLAAELVAELDLPVDRRMRKLSRGMRSAVGVVVGLSSRAPLTVLDEPTLGLDAPSRRLFYDRLLTDVADHPRTVLLSTHLIDEVADVVESVVVLDAGRVVLCGESADLRSAWVRASGSVAALDRFAAGRRTVDRHCVAGFGRAVVAVGPDGARRGPGDLPDAVGVSLEPASLQDVVGAAGVGAPLALEEARS